MTRPRRRAVMEKGNGTSCQGADRVPKNKENGAKQTATRPLGCSKKKNHRENRKAAKVQLGTPPEKE